MKTLIVYAFLLIGCANANNGITCDSNAACSFTDYEGKGMTGTYQSYCIFKHIDDKVGLCYTMPHNDIKCPGNQTYVPVAYLTGTDICSPLNANNYYADICINLSAENREEIGARQGNFNSKEFTSSLINGSLCQFEADRDTILGYYSN